MQYAQLISQGIGLAGSLTGGLAAIMGQSEAEQRIKDRMRGSNLVAQRMFESNLSVLQSRMNAMQAQLAPSLGAGFATRQGMMAMQEGVAQLGNQAAAQAAAEQQAAEGQALQIDQRRQEQILGMIGGAADAVGSFGGALTAFGEGGGAGAEAAAAPLDALDPGGNDPTGMAMAGLGAGPRSVDPETAAAMRPPVPGPGASNAELTAALSPETQATLANQALLGQVDAAVGPPITFAPGSGASDTSTAPQGISAADLNQFLMPSGARARRGNRQMRQHSRTSENLLQSLGVPPVRLR